MSYDQKREAEIREIYRGLQGNMPPFGDVLILLRLLDRARAELEREREQRQMLETRFWEIVDRDGLRPVPSDMLDATSRLVSEIARLTTTAKPR